MNKNFFAVIMAGGGGTRLWPLSRRSSPKQLLPLVEGKSLFQIALERLEGLVAHDHIYIVTIAAQLDLLQRQAPEIPLKNYLIEPKPRGTAAVVGFAATFLQKINPEAVMAVLTADHVMENVPYFKDLLQNAASLAETKTLVTIGIKPESPSTGFGYIEIGDRYEAREAFQVQKFVEKPDEKTAKRYIESGRYFWNSGMFIWSVDAILAEIERQMPDLFASLTDVKSKISAGGHVDDISAVWEGIRPETIDYGIMEGAQNVSLIPANVLGWKDLGSWDSLFSILKPNERGNIELANKVININSRNCYIQSTDPEKAIAVIGVEDLIIVEHENTLLVCKKGESQQVKKIVNALKEEEQDSYL